MGSPARPVARNEEMVAIVGIGCRYPGGVTDPKSFWRLLTEGKDAVREVTADRWSVEKYFTPRQGTPGKTYAKWAGLLDRIDGFEPECFGISPREAHYVDPQQRLLLEASYEALEDAGQPMERLAESRTGVYVGISTSDYAQIQNSPDQQVADTHSATGGAFSIAANRISYCFNLRGPSVAVDTACSSSLVATDLACRGLLSGETDLALAGGVNVIIVPAPFIAFCAANMLSPDGRCKAFDASANGFVRGEGVGVVALKRLDRAIADGDAIYAVIAATGVNQDARTNGITLPSREAQEALVREVCANAGVSGADLFYVEAHGTGTAVGDPTEAYALGTVVSQGRDESTPCLIGSVKSNIGHLEAGAGLAGLIKTALILQNRQIPANLHYREPNPNIPFDELKLRVVDQLTDVQPERELPLVAGVNSFGFGGTNAHVIMREFVPPAHRRDAPAEVTAPSRLILPLTARSSEALEQLARQYIDFIAEDASRRRLADICYTAAHRRTFHDRRLAIVAADGKEAIDCLKAHVEGERRPGVVTGQRVHDRDVRPVFVFSGQGPQWWGMGRGLLRTSGPFREKVEQIDEEIRRLGDWSLLEELGRDEASSRMSDTTYAQPALFALQVGLVDVLRAWGIEPAAVVGHSVGEVAAAHVGGALDLAQAVRVIFHRGRCMGAAPGGRMLALGITLDEAMNVVAPFEDRVSVAAYNSPQSVTLSGDGEVLEQIAARFEGTSTFCRFLPVKYAFHSPQMEPIRTELGLALDGVEAIETRVPTVSTVTGEVARAGDFGADYWWHNVRERVRFADALGLLRDDGRSVFVEISPHPVLATSIAQCMGQHAHSPVVVPTLRRDVDDDIQVKAAVSRLFSVGSRVDWSAQAPGDARAVRLPRYPWRRERYWHEPKSAFRRRAEPPVHPLLEERSFAADPTWDTLVSPAHYSYLGDHLVQGKAVFPAAAYVEMALGAGVVLRADETTVIDELQFDKAMFFAPESDGLLVQFSASRADGSFSVTSGDPKVDSGDWQVNCAGYLRGTPRSPTDRRLEVADVESDVESSVDHDVCYRRFADVGLDYGATFRGVRRIVRSGRVAIGHVRIDEPLERETSYRFHPALLDSCFQVVSGLIPDGYESQRLYLPVRIDRVTAYADPGGVSGRDFHVRTELRSVDPKALYCDLQIADGDGRVLMAVEGFTCESVAARGQGDSRRARDYIYELSWMPGPLPGHPRIAGHPAHVLDQLERSQEGFREALKKQGAPLFERSSDITERLDRLAVSYLLRALGESGIELGEGGRIDLEELVAAGQVVTRHRRLLASLLSRLADTEEWLATSGAEQWTLKRTPPMESPEALFSDTISSCPAFFSELSLVARCGERLAEILRGEAEPLEVLFTYDGGAAAEHFYQDSPSFRFENTFVSRCTGFLAENCHRGETLRVLEVGAGTGGMTGYVLPTLDPERTQYVFTDISSQFFNKAEQNFREYPFVEYRTLDIEKSPAEQGFEPHSFDLVLASDVFHATRDLGVSLGHVKELLAPGGMLMFLEADYPYFWVDCIFGLTPGWWRFEDHDVRPAHPLIEREAWQEVLASSGYESIAARCVTSDDSRGHQIVVQARTSIEGVASGEHQATNAERGEQSTWLVFADGQGVGEALSDRLRRAGFDTVVTTAGPGFECHEDGRYTLSREDARQMTQLIDTVGSSGTLAGIAYLWGLDAAGAGDELSLPVLRAGESATCYPLMHLMQSLVEQEVDHSLKLLVATRRAQSLPGDQGPVAVAHAPLIGMGRLIGSEHPNVACRLVDLDEGSASDAAEALLEEILDPDVEEEAALRGGARFVPRFDRAPPARMKLRIDHEADAAPARFRLRPGDSGSLDTLAAKEVERVEPGPGQVEIEVCAASLNFRDVLKSLNLYPSDGGDSQYLGDECAGHISAVGAGVERLRVGDPVMAVAPGCFSSHVLTLEDTAVRIPPGLAFDDAATIPITFLTAYYALHTLARIRSEDTLLIQAAAGGVGLSALQIARQVGARVFATAGTPEKRDLLRRLGVEHIMDSRSTAFAEEIKEITGGRGVDIILNSLAGEAIPKGISCLAPYGRFLELGKRDIYQNSKLGLWAFRRNVSFFAIDLSRLVAERPAEVRDLLETVARHAESGDYRPLPQRQFSIGRARDAFRYMAQARHIGKVVLGVEGSDIEVESTPRRSPSFRTDATYLVTGGLGGFGLAVAKWLVAGGARTIVLTSRSGAASAEAESAIAEMANAGARIEVMRSDVTDPDSVAGLIADIDANCPPLVGVYHAAMVLDDGLLRQLDTERFRRVMAPKMDGCWNLHQNTLGHDLDCFVLFSSISSLVGNAGQANYVAANSFLDAFAGFRRSLGLPALAVNWGRIAEVGYVARTEEVARSLDRRGFLGITPDKALEALGLLLAGDSSNASVLRMDWHKTQLTGQRFSRVTADADESESGGEERGFARAAILEAPAEKQPGLVYEYMLKQVARVLGVASGKLDPTAPLNEMGLDSLMAVELENKIENDLDVSLPTAELMQSPTVHKLAILAIAQLGIEHGDLVLETSREACADETGLIVNLRGDGDSRPLFCLHAADGSVDIYREFVRAMPEGIPILGVNSVLLAGDGTTGDMSAMAAQYAESISRLAEPPYRLFGFSFGGLMAVRVAEALETYGPLEYLGLVDFRPEWVDPARAKQDLLKDVILGLYGYLLNDAGIVGDGGMLVSEETVAELTDSLLSVDGDDRAKMIIDWVREAELLPEQVPMTLVEEYVRQFEKHLNLITGSRLPVLNAPIYYWQATKGLESSLVQGYDWQSFTTQNAYGMEMACGHWEIMTSPHVEAMAAKVFETLAGQEQTDRVRNVAV